MENSPNLPLWLEDGEKTAFSHIPERRSSRIRLKRPSAASLISADGKKQSGSAPTDTPKPGTTVRPRGKSSSPLRRPETHIRWDSTRTYIPAELPLDLLYAPNLTNHRILLDLRLSSPIFMGGATVEGDVHILIDGGFAGKKRKSPSSVSICKMFVTVVGIESCKARQEMFRVLMTDLIDQKQALSPYILPILKSEGARTGSYPPYGLPFCVDLPVNMGPPPYESKKAGIRYLVSATVEAMIGGKRCMVRQSREIAILSVHDPEKALVSLSDPLLVSDELHFSNRTGVKKVALSAGIHRQTWISGYPIFVDIQIDNQSNKSVKKVELQLERTTTYHSQPAPATIQGAVESLRIPDQIHKEVLAKEDVSHGLHGIVPVLLDFRTYQMDLPRGLVSIEMGRFFGVRFFLSIQIYCSFGFTSPFLLYLKANKLMSFRRRLKIQLPITIIHPNSIDIPTNALAQVTASIEHKHRYLHSSSGTGSPYRYHAGQAFLAARRRSHLQLRQDTIGSTDIDDLTRVLEASPRRHRHKHLGTSPLNLDEHRERRMRITRRRSAAALAGRGSHRISRPGRASFDDVANNVVEDPNSHLGTIAKPNLPTFNFPIPRNSNDPSLHLASHSPIRSSAAGPSSARVSFETPPPVPGIALPPTPRQQHQQQQLQQMRRQRSSLEEKVHRGLRGLSIDTTTYTHGNSSLLPQRPERRTIAKNQMKPGLTARNGVGNWDHRRKWGNGPRLQKSTSGLAFDTSDETRDGTDAESEREHGPRSEHEHRKQEETDSEKENMNLGT